MTNPNPDLNVPLTTSMPLNMPAVTPGAIVPDHLAPHRPAGDTEEVYFEGSPLLRGELGKGLGWLIAGLVVIALPILAHVEEIPKQGMPWWLWLGFFVVGILIILVPYFRAKLFKFRVTNYRIDFERGFLSRSIDTLELWHVEDLRFHQSLMDRILGVGTITILSKHPTTPVLVMRSIPNAQKLFMTLEQRVIAVKRQAGVIKVDTGTIAPG